MLPLTVGRHKAMLKVGDRTIIDRIIGGLLENGIDDVLMVTGYRAEELEHYVVEAFPRVRFTFVRNGEYETTNNIHSLALAFDELDIDSDVLLLECDLVFDPHVLRQLVRCEHDNVALVDSYRAGMDGTVVALSETGVISEVILGASQGPNFFFGDKFKTLNLYKFSATFCRETFGPLLAYYTRTVDRNCYYELILGILVHMQHAEIRGEVVESGSWAEVDDPIDLDTAEFVFDIDRRRSKLESSWGGYWRTPVTDFAFIRNMHFPPDSMLSQLKSFLGDLIGNYGSSQQRLNEKLAYFLMCCPENVHFLNGASQFFPILASHFAPGDVLVPEPTFGEFTRVFPGADSYADRGALTADSVLDRLEDRHRLVVVVTPNNPTGSTLDSHELRRLIRATADRTLLIDESFVEFSGEPSNIPWLDRAGHPHVLVLKSLSKTLGVPGLRVGLLHTTDARWRSRIADAVPIWNVNSVAEHFVELLLKYRPELERSIARTVRERAEFASKLASLDIVDTVYPSGANFLLVRLYATRAESCSLVDWLLRHRDVYVKDVSSKFVEGGTFWRLAIRTTEENAMFCSAFDHACRTILASGELVSSPE